MKKSVNNRGDMPGSAYIRKILEFNEKHVESGELYAEFLKGSCKEKDGSLCEHCCVTDGPEEIAWTGPATERIPRPIPDQSALPEFKYLSVHTSSNNDENGKKRIPDDWQPRSNIKKLFKQGKLSINASDAITEFSSKFIVDEKLVKSYIEHLSQLQSVNEIRKQERRKEKQVRALKDVHQSINQSFILTRCVKELKNSFKIRTCINKIYNNYNYIILFNCKNNSINRYI